MLKQQLRYTLLFFMAVVIALGGTGAYLLTLQENTYQLGLEGDYAIIRAAYQVDHFTTGLNARYLVKIGQREVPVIQETEYFEEARRGLVTETELIAGRMNESGTERAEDRLRRHVSEYLEVMSGAIDEPPAEYEARRAVVDRAAELTVRICDEVEAVVGMSEARLLTGNREASLRTKQAVIYLWVVSAVALVGSWFLFRHLGRAVLEPIEGLQRSIGEVKRGNFEHAVPVVGHHELASLASSFNEMAAELAVFRRETDQQLMDLHDRNEAIFQTFPHPIFLLGENGGVIVKNPQAARFQEALNLGVKLPKKVEKLVTEAVRGGVDYLPDNPSDAVLFRIDEQETFYLPRLFHIFDSEKKPRGWALILSDITRVRWLDDIKTNMISTISHEIKTPLTSIRMMLHLLGEENSGELNEAQREMVTSATEDCERLLVTLEKLLEISHRGSGTSHLDLLPTKPHVLFEPIRRLFEAEAAAKNLRVTVDLPKDLPDIQADPLRVQQVMSNLTNNAVKYCPEGGEVTVVARKEGADFVRFLVTDTGPGVPAEAQDHIFDRFYRAPNQNIEGTGLGLSISREIIAAHQGRIGLLSEPSGLTTFYFDLPLS